MRYCRYLDFSAWKTPDTFLGLPWSSPVFHGSAQAMLEELVDEAGSNTGTVVTRWIFGGEP